MFSPSIDSSPRARSGFSLVEVVIAVGIFATAVLSIVGLLLPNTQKVSDQIEADVARRLSENVQIELQRYARLVAEDQKQNHSSRKGFDLFDDNFFDAAGNPNKSIFMVATRDGLQVLVTGEDPYEAWNNTYNNPYMPEDAANYKTVPLSDKRAAENRLITHTNPANPPGIAFRDRYYLIEVFLPKSPTYAETNLPNVALGFIPVSVRVVWPYRLPSGPANPDGNSEYDDYGDLPWLVVSPDRHRVYSFNIALTP